MAKPSLLYSSFDVVPFPKGAAIHIGYFARSLAQAFGALNLVTVAPNNLYNLPHRQIWDGVEQTQLAAPGDNLISRVMAFRRLLKCWLADQHFDVIHIRSPFEGLHIAQEKTKYCDYLIFEVNGLPSIELKYRYPNVADDDVLNRKLVAQEQICLDAADLVVTTCVVSKNYLVARGVCESKIRVIPNGVNLDIFPFSPKQIALNGKELNRQEAKLLYVGTLSGWQGVDLAVKALALIVKEIAPASALLTVVGPVSESRLKQLRDLAQSLGIANNLNILPPVPQEQLAAFMHSADIILAPLTANDRNLVQGCCPLKLLEAMASGTPVIASDLPVVREVADDTCILVKAGSAGSLKEAVISLLDAPQLGNDLAVRARERIETNYTWTRAGQALVHCYTELLACAPTKVRN